MKKVKNDSQPFISYIIPIFVLPFAGFFVGLYFYAILSSFNKINFGSIYGILLSVIFFYVIIRGMKNGILYFIPREECYIGDDNKFIRTYNKLKEMVIEEQSKLSFNKKI